MKKTFIIASCVVVALLGVYLLSEPTYTPTALLSPVPHYQYFPKLVAHKACLRTPCAKNTMGAIENVLASPIEGMELDIRLSKDGVLFVYHGDDMAEETTGRGPPETLTWAEISKMRYQGKKSYPIVSLREVFEKVGTRKFIFLDIKTDRIANGALVEALISLIREYKLQESVVVNSFNPVFLGQLRWNARDILLMFSFAMNTNVNPEELKSHLDKLPSILRRPFIQKQIRRIIRPDLLGVRWDTDKGLMQELVAAGYPLIAWTVDEVDVAKDMFALGVKGLETNDPLRLDVALKTQIGKKPVTLQDGGGTRVEVGKVVQVHSLEDVRAAIRYAKKRGLKITMAGRRHSMGGHTLSPNSVHLNMLGLNQVTYHPQTQTVSVQAGASWKKVQKVLDEVGRSVKVMQSDNIFSVGGSLGVNVHGWQANGSAMSSTVRCLKVMTSDGKEKVVDRQKHPALFGAVMGGYGLLGVITEIELETTANTGLVLKADFFPPKAFVEKYKDLILHNPNVELVYGRLSINPKRLFEEMGLFWYEKVKEQMPPGIIPERLVALKRSILRASEASGLGKKARWTLERNYIKGLMGLSSEPISRNSAMNSDIHVLWPLNQNNRDVLQEYFVPFEAFYPFLKDLKKLVLQYGMNLLNVTVRTVHKDDVTLLSYAPTNMVSLVLLFSQAPGTEEEEKMHTFTHSVIERALTYQGTFYLPYRRHYTIAQFQQAYPSFPAWLEQKKKWDPRGLFWSDFMSHILGQRIRSN